MDTFEFELFDCIELRDMETQASPYYEDFMNNCFQAEFDYPPAEKLLNPSKKISKRKKKTKTITKENAEKLAPFFQKWRELRKADKELKKQIKLWFSSFNLKLNKTYIYREFFGSIRIHFRLCVKETETFSFERLKNADWQRLFINLTSFLINEVNNSSDLIAKDKKSQVYPVWIEGVDRFTIEKFPQETQFFDCMKYYN